MLDSGITALNISIDSLVPAKFDFITRWDNGLKLVLQNIESAIECDPGFNSLKLNVVLMKGFNDDEILDFVDYALQRPLELRFIEFMPFDDNNWSNKWLISETETMDIIWEKYDLIPNIDSPNAVAKTYRVEGMPGHIGFISSMS